MERFLEVRFKIGARPQAAQFTSMAFQTFEVSQTWKVFWDDAPSS